jgi:hypothetical protein
MFFPVFFGLCATIDLRHIKNVWSKISDFNWANILYQPVMSLFYENGKQV